jgi:ribosome biogenesis protein BMS1
MSDLVFCRTWYQVDVPRFCNPVVAYGNTRMLKSHAMLRKERDLPIPQKKDSTYAHHDEALDKERSERVFAGMAVPKNIKSALPFS